MTPSAAAAATTDDYNLMLKKIKKVEQILFKFENGTKGTDNKEYRGYKRKLEQYQAKLKDSREYRANQLENALDDLKKNVLHHEADDDHISVMTGDLSIDMMSLESIESKESKEEEKEHIDFASYKKKYKRVKQILKDLEKEHGKKKVKKRNDYKKYKVRETKEFNILRCEESIEVVID